MLHKGRAVDTVGDEDLEKNQTPAKGKLLSQVCRFCGFHIIISAESVIPVIRQIAKKNAVENILPIVVQLKRTLEVKRSPLVGDVLAYLRGLLKDYRTELSGNQYPAINR